MSKPIAVVTSDCHLADRTWSSRPSLESDAYFSFAQIIEYATSRELPVIAAGDLIDKQKNESGVISFLADQLYGLETKELPFVYVQGQHELQDSPWVEAVCRGSCRHLNGRPWERQGVNFYGIDWMPPESLKEALAEVPEDTDVLVMHQVTQEWMGGIAPAEVSFSQIPHASVLIIGDYHEISGTEGHKGAQGQDLLVLSPGSTCMQAISEPRKKFFYELHDDLTFSAVPLLTRVVLEPPELWLPEALDEFVENVGYQIENAITDAVEWYYWPELVKPIVYVRYCSELEHAFMRIDRAVGDKAHLFYKELRPSPTEEQQHEREVRESIIANGLVGALPEVAQEGTPRYDIAYRLLGTKDPRGELATLRQDRLGLD